MAVRVFVPRDATACALGADSVAQSIATGAEGRGIECSRFSEVSLRVNGPSRWFSTRARHVHPWRFGR